MKVKDIRLDADGDLDIVNGDFVTTESDETHIEHILLSNKGNWFESPLVGVGIIETQHESRGRQELKQEIRRQLTLDKFTVQRVSISDTHIIEVNAKRRS